MRFLGASFRAVQSVARSITPSECESDISSRLARRGQGHVYGPTVHSPKGERSRRHGRRRAQPPNTALARNYLDSNNPKAVTQLDCGMLILDHHQLARPADAPVKSLVVV